MLTHYQTSIYLTLATASLRSAQSKGSYIYHGSFGINYTRNSFAVTDTTSKCIFFASSIDRGLTPSIFGVSEKLYEEAKATLYENNCWVLVIIGHSALRDIRENV